MIYSIQRQLHNINFPEIDYAASSIKAKYSRDMEF